MKPSGLMNQASTDQTDLEFALETQSGFLVVVKGSGNDGRVTLAVRRRVGTPPASAIGLTPDEVKRLINLLGELSPAALIERDKHLVGRARDAYLDDLMGTHNEPENADMDLFIERDFPELANRRKRGGNAKTSSGAAKTSSVAAKTFLGPAKTFLGASSSNPINQISELLADPKLKGRLAKVAIAGVVLVGIALSTVAVLTYKPFASHAKVEPQAAVPAPTSDIEVFSKGFVTDMLTFKIDSYRQAQVRAMSLMTPELVTKYWQETGFPLTKKQLKSIPQDQEVQLTTVAALPISAGLYQVDVEGSVVTPTSQSESKAMPLHIRLTVSKDAQGKLTVTEQKDLSSAAAK